MDLFRVESDGEFSRGLLQEGIGIAALLIEVHTHDGEALRGVLALHLVHPREGFAAGTTPGGPEIDIGELACNWNRLLRRAAGE
jgi:hypothetical protein